MTVTLDTFTAAYIEAALWSSTDDDGEPLDAQYTVDDIHPDALAIIIEDCGDFLGEWYEHVEIDLAKAGHDFWLTRCGHGCGFWDGGWEQPFAGCDVNGNTYADMGEYLTAMAKGYGEQTIYVGDDGKLHIL